MAETLYDKYGGFAAVSGIVHSFYDKVLATESLQRHFDGIEMAGLIDHQIKFLCMVLDGPNNYDGRTLRAAHSRLAITDADFGTVAGLLQETLEESGVETADIATILGVVGGAKADIVTA